MELLVEKIFCVSIRGLVLTAARAATRVARSLSHFLKCVLIAAVHRSLILFTATDFTAAVTSARVR
jgi:hypothetical protein